MFTLLQQTLDDNSKLKAQVHTLISQNNSLEAHILDIKATLLTQNELPPQILLQEPVILHDPLGRIAPFHLEFINSRDAFLAVLRVRFEFKGLGKIIRREFDLREQRGQKSIWLARTWDRVFLVRIYIGLKSYGQSLMAQARATRGDGNVIFWRG